MNRSIRLRIASAVFAVVVGLVALQVVYVLQRFEHGFVAEVDDRLEEGLADLRVVADTDHLREWIAETTGENGLEDEMFVEVRDPAGRLIARSANVPESGFPGARGLGDSHVAAFWTFAHPREGDPHRVRGLERSEEHTSELQSPI